MSSKVVSHRPKVFQIGFNKCATTSLYSLFKKSGYRAVHGGGRHWRETGHPAFQDCNIHRIVRDNIEAGRPPVEGFEAFDAFFDMEQTGRSEMIHNYLRFDAFAEAYPDAKFIFNYRDVNAWCQRRRKSLPPGRSKSRPIERVRLGACGSHIASAFQGALAVRPIW